MTADSFILTYYLSSKTKILRIPVMSQNRQCYIKKTPVCRVIVFLFPLVSSRCFIVFPHRRLWSLDSLCRPLHLAFFYFMVCPHAKRSSFSYFSTNYFRNISLIKEYSYGGGCSEAVRGRRPHVVQFQR